MPNRGRPVGGTFSRVTNPWLLLVVILTTVVITVSIAFIHAAFSSPCQAAHREFEAKKREAGTVVSQVSAPGYYRGNIEFLWPHINVCYITSYHS